jgi:hypothetical protein
VVLGCRVAERNDRADEAVGRQAEELTDLGPELRTDPGDAGAEIEHPCGDKDPLGDPSVVVGVADLVTLVTRQDDRNGSGGRLKRSRLGHARRRDLPQDGDVGHDDEPPRLGVPAAPGPAGNVGDGVQGGAFD